MNAQRFNRFPLDDIFMRKKIKTEHYLFALRSVNPFDPPHAAAH